MARIARKRKTIEIPPELSELSEQIGEFMEYWGFKRIHGRIWLYLYVANEPLDAGDLISRLKISRALASLSIADLMKYEVIQEAEVSAAGTILYRANPEVLKVITHVLRTRERSMLARIHAACDHLQALTKPTKARAGLSEEKVKEVGEMASGAYKVLNSALKYVEGENPELVQWLSALAK